MARNSKVIAPVAVLLLCAVSVVGVGFAYQGSYTDAPVARDIDPYALEVDLGDNFHLNTEKIPVKFDTKKSGSGDRAYTFNTKENPKELVNGEGLVVISATEATFIEIIKFKVTASEKAAKGVLEVDFKDFKVGEKQTDFVKIVDGKKVKVTISDKGEFDLTAGASKEFTVTVEFTLDIGVVNDVTVDNLVIPVFTVTATAATAANNTGSPENQ